jgi:hypothetical protein
MWCTLVKPQLWYMDSDRTTSAHFLIVLVHLGPLGMLIRTTFIIDVQTDGV